MANLPKIKLVKEKTAHDKHIGGKNMKRFELRLHKDLHEKLRTESFKTEKSMHRIVMELIEKHYEKKKDKGEGRQPNNL